MTGEQGELIKHLKDKIHLLMAKYTAVKKENIDLLHEIEAQKEELTEQKKRIEDIEQQYNTIKVASGVLAGDENSAEAKAQINKLVREIDDCIALLNR